MSQIYIYKHFLTIAGKPMKAHLKNPTDIRISACTIAKNEEKTIARSINSYKKYVDEIIVVDTGSTDNTVKVAQELGAKVLHFEWCNDFAAAKNTALDAATGDWIVFLDADEYFSEDSCKNLRPTICEAISEGRNAIGCRMEDIDSDEDRVIDDIFHIRVFKKGIRYHYPIHEEIYNPDGTVKVLSIDKSVFYLIHTGYSRDILEKKCERNLAMLLDQVKKEKNERRKAIYYYYLSDAYYGLKRYKEAYEYANKFLEQSKAMSISLYSGEARPYINIIYSLVFEKAEPELIEPYVTEFENRFPDLAEAAKVRAHNLIQTYQFKKALEKFNETLKLNEDSEKKNAAANNILNKTAFLKDSVYNGCGLCEEGLLHTAKAMDWYNKAINENETNFAYLLNLFRIVKHMPQGQLDPFVESYYMGKSQKRHEAVLTALAGNYMVPQLIKCYAAYRVKNGEDALNAEITAYIMAGKGDFDSACDLFKLNYDSKHAKNSATMCLLCAALSGDEKRISQALEIADAAVSFALGFVEKPQLSNVDLSEIAGVFTECCRLGKADFAVEKMNKLAQQLDDRQILRICDFLAEGFEFEAALNMARNASISAESVFMEGYCLYRLRRLNEASATLKLAKSMGCEEPAIDELCSNIENIRSQNTKVLSIEEQIELKKIIEQQITSGDLDGAQRSIESYMSVSQPDAGIFADLATLLYYRGEYKRAAIAVECGLLIDASNFDLLYNAGCIYEKLSDKERAQKMYKKAIENCRDALVAEQIKQTLGI